MQTYILILKGVLAGISPNLFLFIHPNDLSSGQGSLEIYCITTINQQNIELWQFWEPIHNLVKISSLIFVHQTLSAG